MPTEGQVIAMLKTIIDPHTESSVYEMGLISDLEIRGSTVSLTFTPTTPFCPLGAQLATSIKRKLLSTRGIKSANITMEHHVQAKIVNRILARM